MATRKKKEKTETTGAVNGLSAEEGTAKVKSAEAEPVKSSTAEETVKIPKEKEKKTAARAASKTRAAKKEMKVKAVVQYQGKQAEEKDIIANVKKAWTKSGGKIRDIKSVDLYIKPEEDKVYYVINGTDTGSVAF